MVDRSIVLLAEYQTIDLMDTDVKEDRPNLHNYVLSV